MPLTTIRNGIIHAHKLEFNAVPHCNYGCAECSHLSPYMRKGLPDLAQFRKDARTLASVYQAKRLHIVGGEPLLNPQLVDLIAYARESGLARRILVATNGSLLHKISDDLYRQIDELSVSWYPDPRCDEKKIEAARHDCRRRGIKLHVEKIDSFRMMQPPGRIEDTGTVEKIFAACQIAHCWGCQTFDNGYFYLCSRPVFTKSFLASKGVSAVDNERIDGCDLHAPDLKERLQKYLSRAEPLQSCRYCLGTSGKVVPWRQMSSAERKNAYVTAEPLVDCLDQPRLQRQLALRRWQHGLYRLLPAATTARMVARIGRQMIGE